MRTKTLTQQQVKNRIAETMSEILSGVLGMSRAEAEKQLRVLSKDGKPSDKDILQAAMFFHLKKGIESKLRRSEGKRCTEQELEAVVAEMKAQAPEIASACRKALKDVQKQIRRQGGPGRDQILEPTEQREACEQISVQLKMGKVRRLPDIFEAVAESFRLRGKRVSARTIKRTWENRASLYVG